MNRPVISVEGLSKHYRSYPSLIHRVADWFGVEKMESSVFRALDDINFSVYEGEAVAVVGQNGAGKSTLLKLVTKTVQPSKGRVDVDGRVAAILELGLGFNAEFTGRQNIYQAGGFLGFSYDQLTELLPKIVEFSELGEFIDQPLRVYSSGMQARLAFSLVTATRPDVLIIDEVLAVGDSYFQHKSHERIREFRRLGTTILLVTHSIGDVLTLCDRAILLDKGKIQRDGLPDEVVDHYNALIAEKENARLTVEQRRLKSGWLASEFGTLEARVKAISLVDRDTMSEVSMARVGQRLTVISEVECNGDIERLILGHRITDKTGHVIWGSNTWHTDQAIRNLKAGDRLTYHFDFDCDLGPGSYAINFGLVSSDTHLNDCYHKAENSLIFDVMNADRAFFIGTSALNARFRIAENES